ncbi:hypothetical protein VSS74_25145 [Conexibacter stalactiti]|uniref:Uncharacterized protein n=1 Tax=Conexibacter stalactiti TaxID=1940611 RepID=A0ABU4HWG1_9ACTN|nr:hypothetical protein [Conexibacter stalactiti]MDW5597662.1 hypothetical protein [Conexibacter stalactiti]MEC5038304.1 hypothetical protein [Conexibacter stalactiti]
MGILSGVGRLLNKAVDGAEDLGRDALQAGEQILDRVVDGLSGAAASAGSSSVGSTGSAGGSTWSGGPSGAGTSKGLPIPSMRPRPQTSRGLAVSRFFSGLPTSKGLSARTPSSKGLPIPSMRPRAENVALAKAMMRVNNVVAATNRVSGAMTRAAAHIEKTKKPSLFERAGSFAMDLNPAAGGLSMGRYAFDVVRGEASLSDAPREMIKAGIKSNPILRPLATAGDAYFDEGDPLGILPVARTAAHVGAITGGLRALGVPISDKWASRLAFVDVTTVLGSGVLAARSTHDYVHHRGSFGAMASQTAGFGLGAAGIALPFMRGAGAFSKLGSGRLAARGIEAEEIPEDAVQVISSGKDLLEYGSQIRPGGEDESSRTGGYARGGRVLRAETALVGERGPEIVQLPAGSNVIPAHRSRELLELAGAGAESARAVAAPRQLYVHQYLDGREVGLATVRDLDDDEQWDRGGGRWASSMV